MNYSRNFAMVYTLVATSIQARCISCRHLERTPFESLESAFLSFFFYSKAEKPPEPSF